MPTIMTAGDSVSAASSFAAGNDGLLNIVVGPAGGKVTAVAFGTDGTPTFIKQPVNTGTFSAVRLNTANGYGSTNTMIRRFTNTVVNSGADITYVDSATLGATFTINTSGIYAISYCDNFTSASQFGLSLNSAQLTTSIAFILVDTRLAMSNSLSNIENTVSATVPLTAGSVIRAHASAIAAGGATPAIFTITRVA